MRILSLVWLTWLWASQAAHGNPNFRNHEALEGHQIVRINGNALDLDLLLTKAQKAIPKLDVLHHHSTGETRVRVSREDKDLYLTMLRDSGVEYEVEVKNLATFLRNQDLQQEASGRLEEICDEYSCSHPLKQSYMTFQQMELYMQELAVNNPSRVELTSIGKTTENRDIWMVHVLPIGASNQERDSSQPGSVWIEGGLHAREWISPSSTLHLLHDRVTACETNCDLDYYFVPMANPDGYEYSRTKDRMWRKNRAIIPSSKCIGVDLNRNWDFKYGVGASDEPCSEVFMGPSAFSEPETRALSDTMAIVDNLHLMITFHSYGQQVLYPWGWTNEPVENLDDIVRVGNAFKTAAKGATGEDYGVNNSAGGLYFASGATDDWSKKILNVPYAYTIELQDTGAGGFNLPASAIEGTATEVIAGTNALITEMRKA